MRTTLIALTLTTLAGLLSACGGGGGSSGAGGTATTPQTPTSMSALSAPAVWPTSFKSVAVTTSNLMDSLPAGNTNQVFIQVWYVNQQQQPQTVAFLTVAQLVNMGNTFTLANIPSDVTVLKSEVYTANGANQLTLASKDISV